MDEKKHPTQPEGNQTSQKNSSQNDKGGHQQVSAGPSRRIFAKRWLYPAIYLGAAALIIGLMYARSQMASHPTAVTDMGGSTTPSPTPTNVEPAAASYQWPVASSVTPVVSKGFFEATDAPKKQAAELVKFGTEYSPHLGYDIKSQDGKGFSVTASMAGQVTKVGHSVLNGYEVDVLSNDGNLEKYESLGSADVKVGDSVQQGAVLGTSGTSEYEASQGNHLYFEVDNATAPVDPAKLLPKL